MKFFSYFQSFGFTRNEIKVILLLSATFLLGLAIRYYNSSSLSTKTPEKEFDYSIPDSIFQARSKQAGRTIPPTAYSDSSGQSDSTARHSPININTANKTDLMKLPGIGAAYAERIIAYRDEHGPFKSADELQKVKGIGKKKLDRMRKLLSVK